MISIIIPAHNEEAVIGRCLSALTTGAAPGELEVIVVSNGSSDRTAGLARCFHRDVQVVETPVASKVHALNLGDSVAGGFPRFYVDADVVLPLDQLRRLARRLIAGDILAVAPRFQMQLDGCSWFVRAFYDINDRLPSSREGIGGSGVYGLSDTGRRRFERFPDITADDGFVRVQFAANERATVDAASSIVFAPQTLGDLVRIKTRSHFGSMELRQQYPELWVNRGQTNAGELKRLMGRVSLWPKLVVYGYVKLMARWKARRRLRSVARPAWERDQTSRTGGLSATEAEVKAC